MPPRRRRVGKAEPSATMRKTKGTTVDSSSRKKRKVTASASGSVSVRPANHVVPVSPDAAQAREMERRARSTLPPEANLPNPDEEYVTKKSRGGSRYRGRSKPVDEVGCSTNTNNQRGSKRNMKAHSASRGSTKSAVSAEVMAKHRRSIGAPRKKSVIRYSAVRPHYSRGGSAGAPMSERLLLQDLWEKGKHVPKSRVRSIQRWIKEGIIPLKQTGNKDSGVVRGEHLFLLASFKKIFPQARARHCSCFIAVNASDGRVLTDQEINMALKCLGMTRKKASTTAYEAFTSKNLYIHHCFWRYDAPAGVRNRRRERLLDGDEMAIRLADANENYGHAVKGLTVRKVGHYGRGSAKVTLLMFVEPGDPSLPAGALGSIENPRIWYEVSTDSGTTVEGYCAFIEHKVLAHFRQDEPRRTFLHDNLSSHKADEVYDLIYGAGHEVICRPPYRPDEAPIEIVFDQVACEIRRRWERINDQDDLIYNIRDIIDTRAGMGGINKLFKLCGYRNEDDGNDSEDETEDEDEDEEE